MLLMMPYIILLLWALREKLLKKITVKRVLCQGVKYSFFTSVTIEFLQLGTFQLSDIFYNTLGGLVGSLIYYVAYKIKHKRRNK